MLRLDVVLPVEQSDEEEFQVKPTFFRVRNGEPENHPKF